VLDDNNKRISDLAEVLGTSKPYLQGIVRQLSRANLIYTAKGRNGGISKMDGDVTLRAIIAAFTSDPLVEIDKSDKVSDRLNSLYINFLGAVSIYRDGAALQVLNESHQPHEEIASEEIHTEDESETNSNENKEEWTGGW